MQSIFKDSNSSAEEGIDFYHYFKILKQSWIKIVLFTAVVTALAILFAMSLTPKYTATATLLIEAQENRAISIQDVVGIDSTQAEYYLTQFEVLKSDSISERVIDKLNLVENLEFNPNAYDANKGKSLSETFKSLPLISSLFDQDGSQFLEGPQQKEEIDDDTKQEVLDNFKSKLGIIPITKTQLVKISFTSNDPILAAEIANQVGYAYIEHNLQARLEVTKYASSWISDRLAELQDQLASSEQALADYLVQEKLIDDSGIDALASQELSNLTQSLSEVRDRRIEVSAAYSALKSSDPSDIATISSVPAISNHPQVIAIRSAELQAQNEVNELRKRYGLKHDKMIAAIARLNAVEQRADQTIRQLINGFAKEVQALSRQEALLQDTINKRRGEFQELSVKKTRYESLKREVETNRNVLNVFLTRQKETSATQDFNATVARFSDEAKKPRKPSGPNKKMIVVLAIVASFGFAVFMTFIVDAIRDTIDSSKNFEERFGIIPIGTIPRLENKRFKKRPLDNSVLFDDYENTFGESIRSVRTSLLFNNSNNDNKRLAIMSSLPGEGKTTVSINLAMAFSHLGKTILIDCDLRKSSVAERFGLKKFQQGLSNYLLLETELADCLYQDDKSGLTILPAGMLVPNPQELLSSPKFAELLNILEQKYEHIVIDTPPCLPVGDSLIVAQLTQKALLVVKANHTKHDSVKKAVAKLIQHKVNIQGVILNQVNLKSMSDQYGYGEYGYGDYKKYASSEKDV